ncbi:hypothetical protein DPEC_G00338810 [Dallia pectoralis]|uniref:Uncharacterized protein n=1 Tax=Dallia pectoralis TaxID=75939 RepID=A0ACC2F4V9_DALPE|nr:hypothetical protein DPEC_G00338810 [Dallia pectoralis]
MSRAIGNRILIVEASSREDKMGKENQQHKPVSYRDALQARINKVRPNASNPAQNTNLARLRGSIGNLMTQHPDGVLLSRMRQACPLLLHPELLEPYPSTKHLLASLPDLVRLQGVGVQTLVLPARGHDHGGGKI